MLEAPRTSCSALPDMKKGRTSMRTRASLGSTVKVLNLRTKSSALRSSHLCPRVASSKTRETHRLRPSSAWTDELRTLRNSTFPGGL